MEENLYIKGKIRNYIFLWVFLLIELSLFFYLAFEVFTPDILVPKENQAYIIFLYISYLTAILSVPFVFKIYDMRKKKHKTDLDLKEKLNYYLFTKLIQYALLEFAAILSLIAFYINEMNEPLYMFGITFVTILFTKPGKQQFEKDFLTDQTDFIEDIVYMPDEIKDFEEDSKQK